MNRDDHDLSSLPEWAQVELKAYREFYEGVKADEIELHEGLRNLEKWVPWCFGVFLLSTLVLGGMSCHASFVSHGK